MIRDIVLAGLLHDVGKFAERGDPENYENLGDEATFRYNHAAATFKFLDRYVKYQGRQPLWFNYAAMHHHPSDSEPIEWIVAEADRLSSGMDRQEYAADERQVGQQKFTTPLKPITEFVALKEAEPTTGKYFIPLKTYSSQEKDIFPRPFTDDLNLRRNYAELFQNFTKEFEKLVSNGTEKKLDTLYFLLQKYWWAVPASVRKSDFPDISLFEHSKTTAALAAALYIYHKEDESLTRLEKIKNRKPEKFLLFVGDVGGIQRFIYQISSKGAYSQLKGRSFYIQIINDLIAEYLVEQLGLARPNIIYSNGGKFYLLLPNTERTIKTTNTAIQTVNKRFFTEFDGQIFLRTAFVPLSGEDLHLSTGVLAEKWQEVNTILADKSKRPFDFMIEDPDEFYDDFFAPQGNVETRLCASCYRELDVDVKADSEVPLCSVCRRMKDLGERLKSARFMVIASRQREVGNDVGIFLDKKILLYEALDMLPISKLQEGDMVYLFNSSDWSPFTKSQWFTNYLAKEMLGTQSQAVIQFGFKFYGGTLRFDATFDEIARRAKGNFKKLGILRMDVDHLGLLFRNGLKYYKVKISSEFSDKFRQQKNFYSISRMTTLSSQLNVFFAGYLNHLLAPEEKNEQQKAAIVYAGGDDLFIIGSWDAVLEAAVNIRRKFRSFTCQNPAFTLSGGLAITGGKFPIYKSAEYAGEAEELAKHHTEGDRSKDSFTLFGVPLFWEDVFKIYEYKNELFELIEQDPGNRSFLQHLRRIANEFLNLRIYYKKKNFNEVEIRRLVLHERWLWRMVYDLARFRQQNKRLAEIALKYEQMLSNTEVNHNKPFIELLPVLVQWVDYLTRKDKKEAL